MATEQQHNQLWLFLIAFHFYLSVSHWSYAFHSSVRDSAAQMEDQTPIIMVGIHRFDSFGEDSDPRPDHCESGP